MSRFRSRVGAAIWLSRAVLVLALLGAASVRAQDYGRQQLSSTRSDEGDGYVRLAIDIGPPALALSTILPAGTEVVRSPGTDDGEVRARLNLPGGAQGLKVEIRHIAFDSFADARIASFAILVRGGFNRVSRDTAKSNGGFALAAGAVARAEGGYGRLARVAAISRGKDVVILSAILDHAAYGQLEPLLARLFGGIRMVADQPLTDVFTTIEAATGNRFLVPAGWTVTKTDKPAKAGGSDYKITFPELEYPNLDVQVRPDDLETGRELGKSMIAAFTQSMERNSKVKLSGQPVLRTEKTPSGDPTAYSYAREWIVTATNLPMTSEFVIQKNETASIGILAFNGYDLLSYRQRDNPDALDTIFRTWVMGQSAMSAMKTSLQDGVPAFMRSLDPRALGH